MGFSSRKKEISIYGIANAPVQVELLAKLGKHKMGKGCLYVGKLKDIDVAVLASLIRSSARAKGG